MSWSDPISDMLTRIRNAQAAGLESLGMPHSKLKGELVRILKREGYINDFGVEGSTAKKTLRVFLKYVNGSEPAIRGIRRNSTAGRRVYVGRQAVPRILGGMGVAIISTPRGILTDKEARKQGLGGEWICSIW